MTRLNAGQLEHRPTKQSSPSEQNDDARSTPAAVELISQAKPNRCVERTESFAAMRYQRRTNS